MGGRRHLVGRFQRRDSEVSCGFKIRDTNITVQLDFGVATSVSPLVMIEYAYKPVDGVLGLAPGNDSQSFFHRIRPHIDRPIVSIWLSR